MIISCFILAGLALALSGHAADVGTKPTWGGSLPYGPGKVDFGAPISVFAPASLDHACKALSAGDTSTANREFADELGRNPNDLEAWLGYIQSTSRSGWHGLLVQYSKDESNDDTTVNEFKLGVVAEYIFASRSNDQSNPLETDAVLSQIARANIAKAYNGSEDPVVAFVVGSSGHFFGTPIKDPFGVLLRRQVGERVYGEYALAKRKSWTTPVPEAPATSKRDLLLLHWTIGELRSEYGFRHGHPTIEIVGGRKQTVWAPNDFTLAQKEAMDWLTVWQKRIDAKIASK